MCCKKYWRRIWCQLGQKLKCYSFVLTEAVNHVSCCCFKMEVLILCLEFCFLVMSTYNDP
jgi:hypothetical protein